MLSIKADLETLQLSPLCYIIEILFRKMTRTVNAMEDIRDILQVKIESSYWDEAYEMALAEPEVPCWLDGEFFDRTA